MCRWLKTKPRAINRILHSAAAIRSRRIVLGRAKAYRKAYGYLRDHIGHLDYGVSPEHLPIGSGVTEAACKTVFSQRLKRSGMAWSVEGGQRIVDLRVIHLSGVWSEVHQSYLQSKKLPEGRNSGGKGKRRPEKPHNPRHWVRSHPCRRPKLLRHGGPKQVGNQAGATGRLLNFS